IVDFTAGGEAAVVGGAFTSCGVSAGDELAATCCGGGSCAPFGRASGATPPGIRSIPSGKKGSQTGKARSGKFRAGCNAQGSRNNNTTEPTMAKSTKPRNASSD